MSGRGAEHLQGLLPSLPRLPLSHRDTTDPYSTSSLEQDMTSDRELDSPHMEAIRTQSACVMMVKNFSQSLSLSLSL